MPVPNTFANATATIPLSQLDANFATTITLGNTAIQLGNTVSTLNNMTLANVTVTSGNVTITNVTVTTANVTNLITGNAAITGGAINGTTLGATTASTANVTTLTTSSTVTINGGTATQVQYLDGSKALVGSANLTFNGTTLSAAGLSDSGNLTFTGTGNRITGDFSNATQSNIVSFQTSTANAATSVSAIPSGTNNVAAFTALNSSDPNNASYAQLLVTNSVVAFVSSFLGTGTLLPVSFGVQSERMRIDTSGNVGIGTSSPTSRLQVWQTGAATSVKIDGIENPIEAARYAANADGSVIFLAKSRNATVGSHTILQNGDQIGVLQARGSNGTSFVDAASIVFAVDGTPGAGNDMPGRIVFNTSPDGTASLTERMRIDSSGNVGIGTSSPTALLDVRPNTINSEARIGSAQNSPGATYTLRFSSSGLSGAYVGGGAYVQAIQGSGIDSYSLAFGTANTSATATERARITSGGDFGIGTSSPNALLDAYTTQGGSRIAATHGTGGSYPKVSGISFGATSTSISPSNNGGTTTFVGGAGIYANNTAASNNPTDLVFWTTSGGVSAERVRIDASGYTQFSSNLVMPYQGAPTSKAAAATLSGAELITGILNTTGTTYTITLPTGTNIEGALTWAGNNVSLDWTVINTASGTITIGANGNTTLGSLTIATGTSAGFRIRRTAANTFTVYRMR